MVTVNRHINLLDVTNESPGTSLAYHLKLCFGLPENEETSFKIYKSFIKHIKFRYLNTTIGGEFKDAEVVCIDNPIYILIDTDTNLEQTNNELCIDEICIPVDPECLVEEAYTTPLDFHDIATLENVTINNLID